jgi:hypothetical protein
MMNRTAKLFDFWARAEEGERVDEKNFTLKMFWKNLKKITEDYQIDYNPQKIVPTDDELLDRIFLAGKELLLKTGIYCRNAERIIKFESQEIEEKGKRGEYKILIGGSATSRIWAEKIGVDGYGADAGEAIKMAKNVLKS